jgi:predicted PurR-regulated permease PerM
VAQYSKQQHQENAVTRNWLLGGLLFCAVLTLVAVAAPVATPIFMAAFIASVLRSPVRVLVRWRIPRPLAAVTVFLGFLSILVALVVTLYEPASRWVGEAPTIIAKIERNLSPLRDTIEEAQSTAERLEKATELSPATVREPVRVESTSLLERIFETSRIFIAQVAVTLVLALFLIAFSTPLIPDSVTEKLGPRGDRLRASLDEIEVQMSRYMGALALVNVGVGVLTATAMYFLGLPTPLLWGVIAAVLGLIPYVGPLIVAFIIGCAAMVTFDTWTAMLLPVLAYVIINLIESEFVTPLVLGKVLMLHPVAIFIFVLLWSWILGLAGAFLAVPILIACVITARGLILEEGETLADAVWRSGGLRPVFPAGSGDPAASGPG